MKSYFKPAAGTEVKARVKSKREDKFLRYNPATGTVKTDTHFITEFVLPSGDEVTSYSKDHYGYAVGKSYNIKVSWCKMPSGKHLLYV